MRRQNIPRPNKKRLYSIIGLATVAALIIVVGLLEATNTTHFFGKEKPAPTASSYTKGEPAEGQSGPGTKHEPEQPALSKPGNSTAPAPQKEQGGGSPSATLLAPTGNFVSNHYPNLSGSPAPNSMNSSCTSTPGASCTITFTMGGTTKQLPAQTTDRGGSTYWDWKLQDVGLTAGSWQIQAKATLNGQTKTAADAQPLEVKQ